MELISVIVPIYNVEQYLIRCVSSIRQQSYRELEIILVDDESPDRCPQICEELKEADPRIRVVHKKNGGLGFARNSGLEVARGAYVTFVDSDDWLSKDHIENLYGAAVEHQADVVIGAHTVVSANGAEQKHSIQIRDGLYEGNEIIDGVLLPLLGPDLDFPRDVELTSSTCMNLYRMEVIRTNDLRFISERYAVAEDLYFNVDFFMHSKRVALINEQGYFYFENHSSISRRYDPKRFERTLNYYEVIQKQVDQYGLTDRISYRIDRTFIMKVRLAIRHIILSDMPKKKKRSEIRRILQTDTVEKALASYPVETLIPAMRILAKWMRDKKVRGICCLIWIRENAKKVNWLKEALKRIGIGK